MERYSVLKQMQFDDKVIQNQKQSYEQAREDAIKKNIGINKDEWEIMRREVKDIEYCEDREDMQVRPIFHGIRFDANNVTLCADILSNQYSSEITDVLFRSVNFSVKADFRKIILCPEYEMDLINEIYLYTALQTDKPVEEFFGMNDLSHIRKDHIYSEWEKYYESKRKGSHKKVPFAVPEKNKDIKKEMRLVGCGIVRTWLYAKDFRNLFRRIYGISNKYKWSEILKTLKKGLFIENFNAENKMDVETASESESIIMEKIFGFNTIICFNRYIRPYVNDFSEKDLESVYGLMEKVMKFEGCYGRCRILKAIQKELMLVPNSPIEYRKRMFCRYKDYLEDTLPHIREDFKNLVEAYACDVLKEIKPDQLLSELKRCREMAFCGIENNEPDLYCMNFKDLSEYKNNVDDDLITAKIIQIIIDGNLQRYLGDDSVSYVHHSCV